MVSDAAGSPVQLQVGQILDFVVVSYTHKNIGSMRGRSPLAKLEGQIMFARTRQYAPQPERESNLWVVPLVHAWHPDVLAIPVQDLCSYLHRAQERAGRPGYANLITVAKAFVNE
jgi:hypothetical protein